jgi:prevent-host-death family protein
MAIADGYHGFMKVNVAEAKNKLTELLRAAEKGKRITICRRGEPIVDMVPTQKPTGEKVEFDTMKGKIIIHDPNWWHPMTDSEVDAMLEDHE